MDHGGSELQRSLLILAAQKQLANVPTPDAEMKSVDPTLSETQAELHGWKTHSGDPRESGRQFRPEEIRVKKYNTVRGTVSKAFKPLELRGYPGNCAPPEVQHPTPLWLVAAAFLSGIAVE